MGQAKYRQSKEYGTHDPPIEQIHFEELIASLVSACDSALLLELYYWSIEPDFLPIIRGIASLPPETRKRLRSFLDAADPKSIFTEIDTDGSIRLIANDDHVLARTRSNRRKHA
jgi:hypothetical protein